MRVSVVQKVMKVHTQLCNMAKSVKRENSSTWIVLLGRGWGMGVYPPYLPTTDEKMTLPTKFFHQLHQQYSICAGVLEDGQTPVITHLFD